MHTMDKETYDMIFNDVEPLDQKDCEKSFKAQVTKLASNKNLLQSMIYLPKACSNYDQQNMINNINSDKNFEYQVKGKFYKKCSDNKCNEILFPPEKLYCMLPNSSNNNFPSCEIFGYRLSEINKKE